MQWQTTRLLDQPIIHPDMDNRMGSNINGPSVIATPEWLPERLGNYYLYFADHKGTYIRLAYADVLTGPWTIHTPGALDVADSLFEKTDPAPPAESERAAWSRKLEEDFLYAHIASPDVHVDSQNKVIRMYYHGLLANGDQQTRVAESVDGIHFRAAAPLLGPPYFRVFAYQQYLYAVSWAGEFSRATSWNGPFEPGPRILPDPPAKDTMHGCRHCAVACIDDTLTVFYSRIGDQPERIVFVTVTLGEDWNHWQAGEPQELMRPQTTWEGTDCDAAPSIVGIAENRVQELRDPCFFKDADGKQYLLYSGAGENAIGIASLTMSGSQ